MSGDSRQTASEHLEAMDRGSRQRVHNHSTPAEVRHKLNISRFEYLLLWLAKTDFYVLGMSTYNSKTRLHSLGLMVLFTASLAFTTSLYTLLTMLVGSDTPAQWGIGLFLALIYTSGIIIIDREIV